MSKEKDGKLAAEIAGSIDYIIEAIEQETLVFQYDKICDILNRVVADVSGEGSSSLPAFSTTMQDAYQELSDVVKAVMSQSGSSDTGLKAVKQELTEQLKAHLQNSQQQAAKIDQLKNDPAVKAKLKVEQLASGQGKEVKEREEKHSESSITSSLIPLNHPIIEQELANEIPSLIASIDREFDNIAHLEAPVKVTEKPTDPQYSQKLSEAKEAIIKSLSQNRAEILANKKAQARSEVVDKYALAVRLTDANANAEKLIAEYQAKQLLKADEAKQKEAEFRGKLTAGSERSVEDYLLVQEDVITREEAALFNYQQLNTYGAYNASDNNVSRLFAVARKLASMEKLSDIPHEKISDILHKNFIVAFEKGWLDFEQFNHLSNQQINDLKSLNDELKVKIVLKYDLDPLLVKDAACFSAQDMLEEAFDTSENLDLMLEIFAADPSKARENFIKYRDWNKSYIIKANHYYDFEPETVRDAVCFSHQDVSDQMFKIFKADPAKAKENFAKYKDLDNSNKITAVKDYNLDPKLVKNSKCFNNLTSTKVMFSIFRAATSEVKENFEKFKDFDNGFKIAAISQYNLNPIQVKNAVCFNTSDCSDAATNLLELSEADRPLTQAIFALIKDKGTVEELKAMTPAVQKLKSSFAALKTNQSATSSSATLTTPEKKGFER